MGDSKIKLPVVEAFYTIQGEGTHAGRAAYFIRLGGCDVGCHWCDVKESWEFEGHPMYSSDELLKMVSGHPSKLVVITGGEPFMHDLSVLTHSLRKDGFEVNVETSGAHPLSGEWDWICLSPKKFMAPREEFFGVADELKVIIYNKSDFAFAQSFIAKLKKGCKLLLQPEWGRRDQVMPEIVKFVKENPSWEISLQSHKYLQIP